MEKETQKDNDKDKDKENGNEEQNYCFILQKQFQCVQCIELKKEDENHQCSKCKYYKECFLEQCRYDQFNWRALLSNLITMVAILTQLEQTQSQEKINIKDHFLWTLIIYYMVNKNDKKFFHFNERDIVLVQGMDIRELRQTKGKKLQKQKQKKKKQREMKEQNETIKDRGGRKIKKEQEKTQKDQKDKKDQKEDDKIQIQQEKKLGQVGQDIFIQGQEHQKEEKKEDSEKSFSNIDQEENLNSDKSFSVIQECRKFDIVDHIVSMKQPKYTQGAQRNHYMPLIRNIEKRNRFLQSETFQHFSHFKDGQKLYQYLNKIKQQLKGAQKL